MLFKEAGCCMRFFSLGRQRRAIWPVKKAAKRCGKNSSHAKRGRPSIEAAMMEKTKEGPTVEAKAMVRLAWSNVSCFASNREAVARAPFG